MNENEKSERQKVVEYVLDNILALLVFLGLAFLVMGSLRKIVERLGDRTERRATIESEVAP